MKIREKMFLIIGIPLISILIIFCVGLISYIRIDKTVEIMTGLEDDMITMVEADRDAYQANLATLDSMNSITLTDLQEHKSTFDENINQTWERITGPGERFDSSLEGEFSLFKSNYNKWKENSGELYKLAETIIDENIKIHQSIDSATESFSAMRDRIDLLGEEIDNRLSGELDINRRLELEEALSLVLNGDRDAYQAYLTLFQIFDIESFEQLLNIDSSSRENIDQTRERVNRSAQILNSRDGNRLLAEFNNYFETWEGSSRDVITLSRENYDNFNKIEELETQINVDFNSMRDNIDKLGELQKVRIESYKENMHGILLSARIIYIVVFILALVLSTLIAILIATKIIDSLKRSISSTEKLTNGDLTVKFDVHQDDEIGALANSLRGMVSKLHNVVNDVVSGSEQIASASTQLAMGNQDLSTRTEQQATALEETSAAIEEMNSSIRSNADNTITANSLSNEVSDKADEGTTAVNKVITSMNEISDSSNRITDIIEVINNIAFQTNLLALNASIEAARAGEQGKGFAVVAVEVRKLAKRSDKAAKEIAEIIKSSNRKVSEGVDIANEAGGMLSEINASVKKVNVLIGEISAASQEQLTSVDQIDKTLSSLDENTQKNASLVEEAAASTEELSAQAVELNKNMKFFKINKKNQIISDSLRPDTLPNELREEERVEVEEDYDEVRDDEFDKLLNEDEFKEF